MADHDDMVWIGLEQGRSCLENPLMGVLQVLQNGREFRFGCQAIVNRNDHKALLDVSCQLVCVDSVTAAPDERTTVEPQDHRTWHLVCRTEDVGMDVTVPDGLVNVGLLYDFACHTTPRFDVLSDDRAGMR